MKVIILNGSNRTGKNKFSKYFEKNENVKIFEISTVDHIKKAAKKYFGWDGKKTEAGRQLLVDIKQACIKYNDGPFHYVTKKIAKKNCEINFVHCREPYEIQKFKDYYKEDLITVLLKKDDREVADNDADKNVSNYDYDYIIDNNGTELDLENRVLEFIKNIKV